MSSDNSARKDEIAEALRTRVGSNVMCSPSCREMNAPLDAWCNNCLLQALTLLRGRADTSKVVTEFATCDGTRPAFDPPVWLMQAADAFAGGHISTGKLAELLGASDIHAFKVAAGAFVETPIEHYANRYEYVHHLPDCPSIGGYGDEACRCGAVAFLKSLDTFEERTPSEEGWQPIETAPIDRNIVAWLKTERSAVIAWDDFRGRWNEHGIGVVYPTHWMPLPTPPASGGEGAT